MNFKIICRELFTFLELLVEDKRNCGYGKVSRKLNTVPTLVHMKKYYFDW